MNSPLEQIPLQVAPSSEAPFWKGWHETIIEFCFNIVCSFIFVYYIFIYICIYVYIFFTSHILHSYTLFYGNVHFNGCQMPLIFSHSRNPLERCRGPTRWQVLLERKSPGKKDPTHDQKQTDGWWNLQDVKVIYTLYIYLLEDIEQYMWYDIWIYVWLYIYTICMILYGTYDHYLHMRCWSKFKCFQTTPWTHGTLN